MILFRNFVVLAAMALVTACVAAPEPQRRPPVFIPAPKPQVPRHQTPPPPVTRPPGQGFRTGMNPAGLAQAVRSLWAGFDGRAGISIMPLDMSWTVSQRGDEPMPQQSVSKLWVALTFLSAVDAGRFRLSDTVTLTKADLTLFHQPIAEDIGDSGYTTTLSELLERAMTQSDNTCNDYLLRKVGGPDAVRAFLASKGLTGIKFGPGEKYLQAGTAGLTWRPEYAEARKFQAARAQLTPEARLAAFERYAADPVDGATPNGIARGLVMLKRGELLSLDSTARLLGLMAASETGKLRLHAGVPPGWGFAHKTGTGQDLKGRTAGYNDVSIMTAPDGTSYAVVVQIADTRRPIPERQAFMQGISSSVAAYHGN
jgi:beta-lactamase class A